MRIVFVVFALLLAGPSAAASLDEDVARYVQTFSGERRLHSEAAESLSWMGISDTRLFDVVQQRLLEDHQAARNDRPEKDRVARYLRALGFSGQPRYVPTLNGFVKDPVYARYARAALEDLPLYQKWNPVISNRATFDPKYSDDVNRVMNMLRYDDFLLKRVGAKRVYFKNQDDDLLELLSQQVKASLRISDSGSSDAIAWMVKALGHARKEKYRALLVEARDSAADPKVRHYASAAVEGYR
jgi:hypothetical protein